MKTKKIKLQAEIEITVPVGTKVIASNDWITLARKRDGIIEVFSYPSEEIKDWNVMDDELWFSFRQAELEAILKM